VILELAGVARHFGGVKAVDGVDLAVGQGELLGLIGPNGSGKTTLIDLVSGFQRPDRGTIVFAGRPVAGWQPHRLAEAGLARTFQRVRLFGALSVLDNVLVGMHGRTGGGDLGRLLGLPGARASTRERAGEARALLERVGLTGVESRPASSLAYGQQRRLEIARALALSPRLLLLDEPVAGMNPAEVGKLSTLFSELNAEGLTMILVEHHLRLVVEVCTRVVVLNYGRKIADGWAAAVLEDPVVAEAYLGKVGVPLGQEEAGAGEVL
jgi:ABC-type branched-subunit amino acid transport system ATPase component